MASVEFGSLVVAWRPNSKNSFAKNKKNKTKSDGLQPNRNGLQSTSDGLQPKSDGLQPSSDGLQPNKWPLTYSLLCLLERTYYIYSSF